MSIAFRLEVSHLCRRIAAQLKNLEISYLTSYIYIRN